MSVFIYFLTRYVCIYFYFLKGRYVFIYYWASNYIFFSTILLIIFTKLQGDGRPSIYIFDVELNLKKNIENDFFFWNKISHMYLS